MPAISSYDYAIIRVVPCVDRGECLNVGVILYCQTRRFLKTLVHVDVARLHAFAPHLAPDTLQTHLDYFLCVCEGQQESGPVGQLSQSERFHWLVSPRSTIIQTSPVHSGLSQDPQQTLDQLLQKLVL